MENLTNSAEEVLIDSLSFKLPSSGQAWFRREHRRLRPRSAAQLLRGSEKVIINNVKHDSKRAWVKPGAIASETKTNDLGAS